MVAEARESLVDLSLGVASLFPVEFELTSFGLLLELLLLLLVLVVVSVAEFILPDIPLPSLVNRTLTFTASKDCQFVHKCTTLTQTNRALYFYSKPVLQRRTQFASLPAGGGKVIGKGRQSRPSSPSLKNYRKEASLSTVDLRKVCFCH